MSSHVTVEQKEVSASHEMLWLSASKVQFAGASSQKRHSFTVQRENGKEVRHANSKAWTTRKNKDIVAIHTRLATT